MKTILFLFLLVPATICAQSWTPPGILGVEVIGNSAVLKNDSAWRNCGASYEMVLYQLEGDTIGWYQMGTGIVHCDCLFNLSVTLDSLNPGDYFVKTFFEDSYSIDTVYIGLISFSILEQNSFSGWVISDVYQSPCGIVGAAEYEHLSGSVSIVPNPAGDHLIINIIGFSEDINYQIFNYSGLRIADGLVMPGETKINISMLSQGIYFIRIQNRNTVEVRKIFKK